MDTEAFLRIFDDEHEAFLAACARAGTGAAVPGCPGWTVGDLLYHLYEVQYLWHRMVAERRDAFDGLKMPERPADDRLAGVVAGEHVGYAAMLRAFDPTTPIATWCGPQDFAWLARRMAQEIAVHRFDADEAGGVAGSIDAVLASDGIDEFLTYFVNTGNGPVDGSIHLHCTDVDGEWTVRDGGEEFVVTREHAKGDCALRGPASDLLLVLWRRRPLSTIDVVGDTDAAARFVAASRLD
jgi:uncharacterized protein (TIGR03083 family)